jgi:hypothetical protein
VTAAGEAPRDPLVAAFEAGTVDPGAFRHREHLYVAWHYLKELPLEEALPRYVGNLRRLVQRLGAPEKYHATVTWAYLVLLDEAMQDPELRAADFDALVARRPALLAPGLGALCEYYDRAELDADEARRRFVLPRAGRRRAPA